MPFMTLENRTKLYFARVQYVCRSFIFRDGDLAARFPRFAGVEFQGRKIVKNSPLVDAYRTETAHDEGADSRIILVRFWY